MRIKKAPVTTSKTRAKSASSKALPRELKARSRPNDTTLQRHVSYFDANGDRHVTIPETAEGLRAMGMNAVTAEATAAAIVLALGRKTSGTFLKVDVDRIKSGKHDSDTGILDKSGRFDAGKFETTFGVRSKVDINGDRAFTAAELNTMISNNKQTLFGELASKAEFGLLLRLGADTQVMENGKGVPALSAERMKSFYDGSLFYEVAREHGRKP